MLTGNHVASDFFFFYSQITSTAARLCFTASLILQQGTASEATLISLLAARCKAVRRVQTINAKKSESEILSKLVAYTSDQVRATYTFYYSSSSVI